MASKTSPLDIGYCHRISLQDPWAAVFPPAIVKSYQCKRQNRFAPRYGRILYAKRQPVFKAEEPISAKWISTYKHNQGLRSSKHSRVSELCMSLEGRKGLSGTPDGTMASHKRSTLVNNPPVGRSPRIWFICGRWVVGTFATGGFRFRHALPWVAGS